MVTLLRLDLIILICLLCYQALVSSCLNLKKIILTTIGLTRSLFFANETLSLTILPYAIVPCDVGLSAIEFSHSPFSQSFLENPYH